MTASEQRGEHVTVRGSDNGGDTDGIQATFATYFLDYIGRTDREQIRSRINNNDCRTFCTHVAVLYAVDKGLRGRNVLQSLLLILLRICSRSVRPISTK